MGRAPMGLAGVADSVAEQKRLEATLGVLEVAEGICTGPRQSPHGFSFDLRDLDGGELPRARQAGQWLGVPAVGFDAVTGFFWNE